MSLRYLVEHHYLTLAAVSAGVWLAIGVLFGAIYFLTLQWNVRLMLAGSSLLTAWAVQVIRLGAIAVVLGFIANHFGPLALLASGAGIQAARIPVVRFGARS